MLTRTKGKKNTFHQLPKHTQRSTVCLKDGGPSTWMEQLEAEVIPHSLPSHQKQIQAEMERKKEGKAPKPE